VQYSFDPVFAPSTVAVIGASENPDKLGFHVMKSLLQGGFQGTIVPINPGAGRIFSHPSYPSIAAFEGSIDLAVVVVPASLVSRIFEECRQKHVRGIIVITAGFKEIQDPAGGQLQLRLARMADKAQIPVIGPNTFGLVNRHKGLNASFTPEFSLSRKGHVSIISQSGGISHLLAFMAMRQNIGISKIVGLGNRLNVDFADILPFFFEDPDTRVVALYIEGLEDPLRLMQIVRTGGGKKPVLALKSGGSETGDQASLSHTGSIAGDHQIYAGALKQAGIFCVNSTEELLDLAQAMSVCSLPEGPRIAVLTGQAGPGMTACDTLEAEGLQLASFEPGTQSIVNELLPPLALRTNPVDMGPAWYDPDAIGRIIRAVLEDENVDGLILLMMFASANREVVPRLSDLLLDWRQKKPLITCLSSPPGIWDEAVERFQRDEAVVDLATPERASRTMGHLWRYRTLQERRFSACRPTPREGVA